MIGEVLQMRLKIFLLILLISIIVYTEETTLIYPPFKHSMGYNKANSAIAKMVLGRSVKFHRTMGICALKLNALDDKTTHKDDAILSIFGINNHQIVYNVGMRKLKTYGHKGRGEENDEFFYPTDISVDPQGNIYLTDTYNFRVLKFMYNNEDSLEFVKAIGGYGTDSTSFNLPSMLDYDSKGNVYITDTGNNRIVIMDSLFNTIRIIPNIEKPHGIAVIDKNKGYCRLRKSEGKFIIVSVNRNKLLKLSFRGDTLAEQFGHNLPYANIDFNYIDYDYNGNIWVTDTINSCVHKFNYKLKYITSFGREGYGKRQFYKPQGISIYRKYGQVFIAEKPGFQYYWIGVDGWIEELTPSVIDDSTQAITLTVFNTEQCKLTIYITKDGKEVRKLTKSLRRKIGTNYIIWDLKDNNGNTITEKGVYKIKLIFEAMYSSRGYFKKEAEAEIEKI